MTETHGFKVGDRVRHVAKKLEGVGVIAGFFEVYEAGWWAEVRVGWTTWLVPWPVESLKKV